MFFTIWYGVYNTSSEELNYSSGGHPAALLFSSFCPTDLKMMPLMTPVRITMFTGSTYETQPWERLGGTVN